MIIHKDDIAQLSFLSEYFAYDSVSGIRELQPIEGWKLVYEHSKRPAIFLIYEMDQRASLEQVLPL